MNHRTIPHGPILTLMLKILVPLILAVIPISTVHAQFIMEDEPYTITPEGDYTIVFQAMPFKLIAPEGQDLYFWRIPPTLEVQSSLDTLVITSAPAGTYQVSVTMVKADWEAHKLKQTEASIKFSVGTPPPPDNPDDSKYKFVSHAKQWSQDMTDGAAFKKAIATNFISVAKSIDDGTIKSVNESQQKLSTLNRAAVTGTTAIGEWTVFFQKWQDYATELNNKTGEEQLRNVASDYAIAYRETAEGLTISRSKK